jgi:integrase
MVERRVGMRVTAHQFRHAAVAVIMKTDPGNIEMARQILGHINIETTMRFYTALESFRATEMFGAIIENEMHKFSLPKPARLQRHKAAAPSRLLKTNDMS